MSCCVTSSAHSGHSLTLPRAHASRVNFIIFLADLEYATATKSAQLLSLGDMDLDLPAIDRAWNAQSAPEWLEHMLSPFNPPAHSFHAALRALMSRSEPARDPFSDQAVLLAELSRISSFPLLILSRTLSFLEKKTEEAIERSDSCKNFSASPTGSEF